LESNKVKFGGKAFLRAFPSLLVKFLKERNKNAWISIHQISQSIKDQLKEIKKTLKKLVGRNYPPKHQLLLLQSDSSTLGCGVWTYPQENLYRNIGGTSPHYT
jgi:hypothetical protein